MTTGIKMLERKQTKKTKGKKMTRRAKVTTVIAQWKYYILEDRTPEKLNGYFLAKRYDINT